MKYAGFWSRASAGFIDFIVFIPIVILHVYLLTFSKYSAIFTAIVSSFVVYAAYNIYLHRRFGQTVGKMVMKIKVVRLNGENISWKEAFLRSLFDVCLAILRVISMVIILIGIPPDSFSTLSHTDLSKIFRESLLYSFCETSSDIWILSEMVILLFNKKKRALHDFIAGTVVIHKPK